MLPPWLACLSQGPFQVTLGAAPCRPMAALRAWCVRAAVIHSLESSPPVRAWNAPWDRHPPRSLMSEQAARFPSRAVLSQYFFLWAHSCYDWKSSVEEADASLKEMGPSFARTPLFTDCVRSKPHWVAHWLHTRYRTTDYFVFEVETWSLGSARLHSAWAWPACGIIPRCSLLSGSTF